VLNDLGYLTGVMLGDGYLDKHKSHYAIRLETTDKRFAERFKESLSRLSENKIFLYVWDRNTHIYTRYYSMHYYCVKNYDKKLFSKLQELKELFLISKCNFDIDFMLSLLIGFYESEGCYCNYKNNYYYISFTNKNKNLLDKISAILSKFGIQISGIYFTESKNEHWANWHLYIYRQNEVEKFLNLIGENKNE